MNIETAEQAREYIESKGIEIIPGGEYLYSRGNTDNQFYQIRR